MNVAAILKHKGRGVTTVRADDTLQQVAGVLTERRIGAVVVLDADKAIAGILSERDIIRAISEGGPARLAQPVRSFMTRTVVACDESDSLDELMELMTARRIRHLPVVTDGELAGIVSIGDVVKLHIAEVEHEASALRDYIATH